MSIIILPKPAQAVYYTDVGASSWYYDAVSYVSDIGLFNGTGDGCFSPDMNMSRGMFVTVLGRMASVDPDDIVSAGVLNTNGVNFRAEASTASSSYGKLPTGTRVAVLGTSRDGKWYRVSYRKQTGYISAQYVTLKNFYDVSSDVYYADYITWAAATGMVSGYEDGGFHPDTNITRQELCVILYNYCKIMGIEIPNDNAGSQFADQNRISAWAAEAVTSLHEAGLINGYGDGSFHAEAGSTRAQVAQVMMNFDKICIGEVEEDLDGVLVNCEGELNMREGPGTNYSVVTRLPNGAMAKKLGKEGDWYHVTYNHYTGYIHSSYCTLTNYVDPSEPVSTLRENLVQFAETLIGVPYVWAGDSPDEGFDCSGFVKYVFTRFDISLPRIAEQQYNYSTRIEKSQLKPGDLVFFTSSDFGGVEHVGIYIGAYEGYSDAFIHSSSSVGVTISSLSQSYYLTHFYGCGRIIND